MGVGRRMKKQGIPMTLEELGTDRKRKPGAVQPKQGPAKRRRKSDEPASPTKLVKLDRAIRQEKRDKKTDTTPKRRKQRFVNDDAQITIPPPMPMQIDDGSEDEDEEVQTMALKEVEFSEDSALEDEIQGATLHDLGEASDVSSKSDSVFDSEEENAPKGMFSEDEDDSDGIEQLNAANIEGLSKKLDKEQAQVEADAQKELEEDAMQTNIAAEDNLLDDVPQQQGLAPDLQLLRSRITETIRVLGNFQKLADKTKSRASYTDLLLADICAYYGYTPYLAEKLFSLFSPQEAFAFFEANETPRPIVLRTNTLRTNRRTLAQSLINRGVVLEPVGKWSKVGLQVFEAPVPLGATPEYLAGHYILQAASSFLPVMALAPQPGERVLDMAAAPGGKTTYISALMRNTGAVFANDANRSRAKGLIGNVHRLGCKNVIVCNYEAQKAFPKILGGFDRILLDAPCSGTGVIGKDPSVKTSKTQRDFLALPHMQKQLLLAAIDSVDHASKTGGYIVYSTCSVTVEENEGVVQYILQKRPNVKIVETGLGSFGSEGFTSYMGKKFDQKMNWTRRYFPHRENVDGFFVCKLRKTGPTPTGASSSVSKANGHREANGVNVADEDTGLDANNGEDKVEQDNFGGFNDEEDQALIERAEKKWLKARGLDPNSVYAKDNETQTSKKPKKEKSARKSDPAMKNSAAPTNTTETEHQANGTPPAKIKQKSSSKIEIEIPVSDLQLSNTKKPAEENEAGKKGILKKFLDGGFVPVPGGDAKSRKDKRKLGQHGKSKDGKSG